MTKYIFFIVFISWLWPLTGQVHWQDKDHLLHLENEKLYVVHKVVAGNTIYNLSKHYNLPQDSLLHFLKLRNRQSLNLGDTLLIPARSFALSMTPIEPNDVKLYYQVKPKENLFRIARIYLGIKEEQIMVLNQLSDSNISIDQLLFVGYLNTNQPTINGNQVPPVVSSDIRDTIKAETLITMNDLDAFEKSKVTKVFRESSGVALWFDDTDVNSGRFIMHETAPVNSIVAIINPMFNKTVYAKVVGNIPPRTYPKEVIAVISPSLAKELGALDKRFFAKIKYEQPHTLGD